LTQTCADLLERKESGLRQLKSTFNAENYVCRLSCLSPAISSQFIVEMCTAAKNCDKFNKLSLLGVQGRSRLSMLTNLKSPSPMLVMICCKSVPTCNRVYTIKANSGKRTFFWRGYPSLTPSFEKNPLTDGHKILSR